MKSYLIGISMMGLALPACVAEMGGDDDGDTTAAFGSERLRGGINTHGIFIEGNNFVVKGWACDRGHKRPVAVRVYANSRTGKFLEDGWADKGRTPNKYCGDTGKAHRFAVKIPINDVTNRLGQSIHVLALSNVKYGDKKWLTNSGTFRLPSRESLNHARKWERKRGAKCPSFSQEEVEKGYVHSNPDDQSQCNERKNHTRWFCRAWQGDKEADFEWKAGWTYKGWLDWSGPMWCEVTDSF